MALPSCAVCACSSGASYGAVRVKCDIQTFSEASKSMNFCVCAGSGSVTWCTRLLSLMCLECPAVVSSSAPCDAQPLDLHRR